MIYIDMYIYIYIYICVFAYMYCISNIQHINATYTVTWTLATKPMQQHIISWYMYMYPLSICILLYSYI